MANSIIACLLAKASLGRMTQKSAKTLQNTIETLQAAAKNSPDAVSELQAAQKALTDGTFALTQKQANIIRNIDAQTKAIRTIDAHIEGGMKPFQAFRELFYGKPKSKYDYKPGITERVSPSIEEHQIDAIGKYESMSYEARHALARSQVTGQIDRTLDRDVFNNVFAMERGTELSGSAESKKLATSIVKLGEYGGKEYKRLGGLINSDRDYLSGFHANSVVVRALSAADPQFENKFIQHIINLGVDVDHFNKTFNTNISDTGQLRQMISDLYRQILSGGQLDKAARYLPEEMRSLATSQNVQRALRFKDAKGAYEFMQTYGNGDMGSHLHNYVVTRGIEDGNHTIFGPSPGSVKEAILDHIKQISPDTSNEVKLKFDRYAADLGLHHAQTAINDVRLNQSASTLKNYFYAATLGRMGLWQTVVDMWNLPLMSNQMKGLPVIDNIAKAYGATFRTKAVTQSMRDDLIRRGFNISAIEQELVNKLLTAADQGIVNKQAAYSSNVARAAVTKWTGGIKSVNGTLDGSLEFLVNRLSKVVLNKDINAGGEAQANWMRSLGLDEKTINFLHDNALSEANWNGHSVPALDKSLLFSIDSEEARNASLVLTRILNDHRIAINPMAPGPYRSLLKEIKGKGAVPKFFAESAGTLSSYFSGYANNIMRMAQGAPTSPAVRFVAGATLLTFATSYEMTLISSLLAGKDAPPMSSDLLMQSLGRALGPIGNGMQSGGSIMAPDTISSLFPGAQFAQELVASPLKLLGHAVSGQFDKLPADFVKMMNRTLPGQTAPIFGLLLHRVVSDQILNQLDPNAAKKFRQQEKLAQTNQGTDFWWAPGELQPSRAPQVSTALGFHSKPGK